MRSAAAVADILYETDHHFANDCDDMKSDAIRFWNWTQ